MSNLYQQIIDQKNKQIKGLKAKVDDQRRIQETQETANAILQKTSLVEENTKLLVGFMGQLQAKDRELGEARTRIMQLEKSLVVKEVENEKLQEQIRSMSKEIAFKDELLENNSKELVNKQLALMNSESRFEDTIAVIKNLQATLKDK
jgi:chromosome segregation ATPase